MKYPPSPTPWPAPAAGGPVSASVRLPGSKSLTARYLLLAALADSPSQITGALTSRDTDLMIAALRALGAQILPDDAAPHPRPDPHPILTIQPRPIAGPAEIDVGLAGTVMRFLPPLAALTTEPVHFDGDHAARLRPMAPLIEALRELGVTIDDGERGHLPFTVRGSGAVKCSSVEVDASTSSQFLSALLLAAPAYGGLTVSSTGAVPSLPHVEMTLAALRTFGAQVQPGPASGPARSWQVSGRLTGQQLAVEPDLSNAGPFLAAAVVTGGKVTVQGWPKTTTQAGDLLKQYLTAFGADVTWTPEGLSVSGPDRPSGVELDLTPAGELTPTLAAIAAVASGPSRLNGIGHLRGHETDRLAALTTEINQLGGRARQLADGLEIEPAPLHGGVVETYGDHRMAMFAAVIGLVVPGVAIRDVATTSKTMPGFAECWQRFLDGEQ
ncbi:MAG: 3-phosphoshikimate 1-carboxyvinyltransferase [Bifidobacteriaceae bacterium]|nr:3-phosphoshikimate 1-carboxyvinyltransferase [Bifidobacteriaceae bacterium]